MTWVKICGTTSLRDAQLSIDAGANALGFVFAPSPRRVEVRAAAEIIVGLPGGVEKVGVFVNEEPARVAGIAEQVGLTGVQLHGDEPASHLAEFRRALGERRIIKTLHAPELLAAGQEGLAPYLATRHRYDAILLDSGSAARPGGTGVPFAWEKALPLAKAIRVMNIRLIIAGGLTAENVGEAIRMFAPWGVDVVSGVETAPGQKDEIKLREFIAAVAQAQTATI